MAAGVLVVLFVGAAAAGGIYVFKPSVFGLQSSEQANEPPITSTTTETNTAPVAGGEMPGGSESAATASNTVPSEAAPDAAPARTDGPTTQETTRTPKPKNPDGP